MAHGDIAVVAPQHHLGAVGNDVALPVDAGVDGGLGPAVADGLDLLNGVRHLHEPQAAGKQLCLEVGTQAEAHDGDIVLVHDGPELVDLGFRQELALVHDDYIAASLFFPDEPLQNIDFRRNHLHLGFQTDAAA